MSDQNEHASEQSDATPEPLSPSEKRLNELDELQQQVAKRLKDNQRFLDRFMDNDFEDDADEDFDDDEEPFEEL